MNTNRFGISYRGVSSVFVTGPSCSRKLVILIYITANWRFLQHMTDRLISVRVDARSPARKFALRRQTF